MATTTKSKATRTSKKPAPAAKKTTKATKAAKAPAKAVKTTKSAAVKTAKTTKNTTVKASEKVAAPVKAEKPVITPLDRIKSVHVSIVAAYAIFAGLVAFAVSTAAVGVTLALQSKNEFASIDATVLGSANEVLFNVEPRYLLIASLLASVIASLLFATKLRNRYEATLANSTSGLRWIATGVSAGLLLTYVNLLVGITDLATLLLSAGFIFATSVFAFAAERDNVGAARPRLFAYSASLFTGAAAWLPAVGALIGTWVYGKEHYGWHVYAIAAVTFLGFSSLALAQRKQLRAAGTYVAAEARYLNIDLLTKFAVVIISLIALK